MEISRAKIKIIAKHHKRAERFKLKEKNQNCWAIEQANIKWEGSRWIRKKKQSSLSQFKGLQIKDLLTLVEDIVTVEEKWS